ncbi:hypothetical protein XENTR_v10019926 [Xenopus tropicalis]|uniref:GLI pathogenesis-related 2 n=1 Tax=Xenopus tropicalis TaxID=8364 RepID=A0A803JR25_XENTR|nr:Golgi-associated plant pathogenesis-related protein 1-like [Xenopus tropicalis]KAE8582068.1 hypothetical protein XENTR_v10019926 [Xenopus tropicalis]
MDKKSFESEFLQAHNKYREMHGAPPLQLSRQLCQSAQEWADQLAKLGTSQHSAAAEGSIGENIYERTGKEPTADHTVDSWYSEIKKYNFGSPGYVPGTGHFTQVIWKESKEVGVGVATDGKGRHYVVGQYNPGGNIDDPESYKQNVLPAGSAAK